MSADDEDKPTDAAPEQPVAPAAPVLRPAAVEPPSPDVAPVEPESALPGTHRGGFERWPTAPVGVTPTVTAPDLDAPLMWAPAEPSQPARGMAAWALGFAIVALVVAMFVGWAVALALVWNGASIRRRPGTPVESGSRRGGAFRGRSSAA